MAKAAKPARRKTAKKQVVARKTSKLGEFRRLIQAAVKKPTRKRAARSKSHLDRKALRALSGALVATSEFPKLDSGEPLRGRLCLGVSRKEDPEILAHRAREERADMVADGIIQPPRKAKRSKVSAKKPRRIKQQVATLPVGLSTLCLVYDGVPMVKRRVRPEHEEQHIKAWKGVFPKAVVEVERKVA